MQITSQHPTESPASFRIKLQRNNWQRFKCFVSSNLKVTGCVGKNAGIIVGSWSLLYLKYAQTAYNVMYLARTKPPPTAILYHKNPINSPALP